MTAKEYLEQIEKLDAEINSKLSILTVLEATATKSTSRMSGTVVSGSRNVNNIEDIIAKIIDLREEINADTDRLIDLRDDTRVRIQKLSDTDCRTVLELRYVWLKPWKTIAEVLCCHLRSVYRIHDRALEMITPLLRDKGVESCHHGSLDGNG